jgi:hypothetical protein
VRGRFRQRLENYIDDIPNIKKDTLFECLYWLGYEAKNEINVKAIDLFRDLLRSEVGKQEMPRFMLHMRQENDIPWIVHPPIERGLR